VPAPARRGGAGGAEARAIQSRSSYEGGEPATGGVVVTERL